MKPPHPGPLLRGEGVGECIFDTAVNHWVFSPPGRDVRPRVAVALAEAQGQRGCLLSSTVIARSAQNNMTMKITAQTYELIKFGNPKQIIP